MAEDILQEISNDKFEEICAFLQKEVPLTLIVLNLLKSANREDWTKETKLTVFCPGGEISSGVVIVMITYLNKCGWKFIKMYCNADKVSLLQQALSETRKLNWTNVIVEGLHFKLLPALESVFQDKNITQIKKGLYRSMVFPSELYELVECDVTISEEFIIRPLTSEDTTLIDETWAYHSPTTYDFIHHSIVYYGGLGLVSKYNGQLVSWAVGIWNTIGMVHTMPEYRKQGCAEVIVKAMIRRLICNNVQPACLIKHENIPSIALFKKLGFIDMGKSYCIDVM